MRDSEKNFVVGAETADVRSMLPRSVASGVDRVPDLDRAELEEVFSLKYRQHGELGSGPALRWKHGYFNPDDCYEAIVRRFVGRSTHWLDVGCGRDLFRSNRALARELSLRCARLVGVDPDKTLLENEFVHEKILGFVRDVRGGQEFDLVTLRMVAEHVEDPESLVADIKRVTRTGALVVVYTVNRWSPIPLITALAPFGMHHPMKSLLWQAEAKDTFPTQFKMNTRSSLSGIFERHGFQERYFAYLDDCRTFQRFKFLNRFELASRRLLARANVRYPENCLLGVYSRGNT